MGIEDEHIDADDVDISAQRVYINGGWSPRAVFLNNLFSGLGALGGTISVIVVIYVTFFR